MKPVIVGESNPYGGSDYYALYPEPDGCAGWRLCHLVMALEPKVYLQSFERVNLLRGSKWSALRARDAAKDLKAKYDGDRVWILLGRKVSEAFGIPYGAPAVVLGRQSDSPDLLCPQRIVLLPHPSGRCRAWANPETFEYSRRLLCREIPGVPFGQVQT